MDGCRVARAVKWHLEDRIIVHGNKTVAFACEGVVVFEYYGVLVV